MRCFEPSDGGRGSSSSVVSVEPPQTYLKCLDYLVAQQQARQQGGVLPDDGGQRRRRRRILVVSHREGIRDLTGDPTRLSYCAITRFAATTTFGGEAKAFAMPASEKPQSTQSGARRLRHRPPGQRAEIGYAFVQNFDTSVYTSARVWTRTSTLAYALTRQVKHLEP